MAINKINPAESARGVEKARGTERGQRVKASVETAARKDVVDVSSRDISYKEVYKKVIDIINKTPDIRAEKVMLIKENLDSLKNVSGEKLSNIAEKILRDLLGR